MARTKLKLSTGVVVEKPVVTCFNVENNTYLILDAENIGSMGLPIILVCKIENGVVKKIADPAEWQKAKDYLKGIIAGNSMNYVAVSAEIAADEIYYTQLTLPVASFDVIKNAYKVEEEVAPTVEPVIEPVQEIAPVIDIAMPVNPIPTEPIVPEVQVEEPVISIEPIIPAVEEPVIPVAEVAPVTEETSDLDFASSKEAFLKACENMYDALVAKFQAELDSKK